MTSSKSLDVLGLQFPHLNLATLKHGPPVPCRSSHWEVQASVPSHAIWALWQLRRQNLAQILLCQCPNPGLLKNNRISLYVSWGTHSQDPATMLWGNPTSPWRSPMGWPAPLGQPGKWAILETHPIAAHQIVSAYPPWSRGEPAPRSTSQIANSCGEDLIIGVLGPSLGWAEMQQWPRCLAYSQPSLWKRHGTWMREKAWKLKILDKLKSVSTAFILYYSKVNRQQSRGSLSQVSFGPSSGKRRAASREGRMEEEQVWRRNNTGQDGTGSCRLSSQGSGWPGEAVWDPSSRQIHEEHRCYFKGAMRKQMSVSNSKFELFCTLCQEILNQVPLVSFWAHTFGLWCQLQYGAKVESLKGK